MPLSVLSKHKIYDNVTLSELEQDKEKEDEKKGGD
jgi:hypothetical protein